MEMYNTGEFERCCGEYEERYLSRRGVSQEEIMRQRDVSQRLKQHLETFADDDGMITHLPTSQILLIMDCTNIPILQNAIIHMGLDLQEEVRKCECGGSPHIHEHVSGEFSVICTRYSCPRKISTMHKSKLEAIDNWNAKEYKLSKAKGQNL